MKILTIVLLLTISLFVYGAINEDFVSLTGVVKEYDDVRVQLSQDKKVITILRSEIVGNPEIKVLEKVTLYVKSSALGMITVKKIK